MPMAEKNYALEWYKYGLEKNDDAIVKFMMHWIAFNWLYSECRQENETENIKEYCYRNYDKLSCYDVFSTDAFIVFKEKPVRDEARGCPRINRFESIKNDSGPKRIVSLMLTIYQVRCNLFHGSKSLHVNRDIELVHASAEILEGYLKAVLQ